MSGRSTDCPKKSRSQTVPVTVTAQRPSCPRSCPGSRDAGRRRRVVVRLVGIGVALAGFGFGELFVHLQSLDLLGAGVVRVDVRHLDQRAGRREHAVHHDDEAVLGPTDAGTALVDVLDVDGDFLAHLDRLALELRDRLVVVIAPLGAATVAVVGTAHPLDSFGEFGTVVCERTIGHIRG